MNKRIILYTILVIAICGLFCIMPNKVFAMEDAIYSITMDIDIGKDGTAKVVEKWDADISSGTELFKQYNNLETSEIKNFTVKENGNKYQEVSQWDSSISQMEKKNTCGINKTSAGIELCWGIGEYGRHEYELEYEITNFVYEYEDSQISNFILIPNLEELAPKFIKITLKSFYKFDYDNVKLQLSGYNGSYSITPKGIIEIYVNGSMNPGESVVADFKFVDEKFSLSNKSVSLTTGNITTKSNARAKKIFITLCGVFALFIIANRIEKKNKQKKELAEQSKNDE